MLWWLLYLRSWVRPFWLLRRVTFVETNLCDKQRTATCSCEKCEMRVTEMRLWWYANKNKGQESSNLPLTASPHPAGDHYSWWYLVPWDVAYRHAHFPAYGTFIGFLHSRLATEAIQLLVWGINSKFLSKSERVIFLHVQKKHRKLKYEKKNPVNLVFQIKTIDFSLKMNKLFHTSNCNVVPSNYCVVPMTSYVIPTTCRFYDLLYVVATNCST